MRTEFNVINDDIMKVPSDVLLLKHAGAFYGADEIVAAKLLDSKRCSKNDLKFKPNSHVIIDTRGAIAPSRVMFLGTAPLGEFGYAEMREFASHAIAVLAEAEFTVRRLSTTIHGAHYGLDAEESLLSLVQGFESALAACDQLKVGEICFVEKSARRSELLASALRHRGKSVVSLTAPDPGQMSVVAPFRYFASNPARDSKISVPFNAST